LNAARREAEASFGDSNVYLEKLVEGARHIEIQILADSQSNVIHLGERECSIQRRHQKLLEEAPSPFIGDDDEFRQTMGQVAVKAAEAVGYVNAGTIEFLVDKDKNFYFLEMNTRLQVEHPVTELITGIDLVKEQILIAEGNALSFAQEDLSINGHAVEVRVYAEDPKNNFLPDIGKLLTYQRPQGPGIRVDDGFEQGMDIPIYYDPMIAKLVAHGETRDKAISRMVRAIEEYQITGIETTLAFCKFVLKHPSFVSGDFDTKFVEKHYSPDMLEEEFTAEEMELLAAAGVFLLEKQKPKHQKVDANPVTGSASNWTKRLKNG
jgi:acetyl/propionyl-CoA carboxylase alpha subunit